MELQRKKNLLSVTVEGDFDLSQCPRLREGILNAIDNQGVTRITFNLGKVDFLDSSALGLILTVYKNVAPLGGGVGVINLNPRLLQYFEMAGLEKIIQISLAKEVHHG